MIDKGLTFEYEFVITLIIGIFFVSINVYKLLKRFKVKLPTDRIVKKISDGVSRFVNELSEPAITFKEGEKEAVIAKSGPITKIFHFIDQVLSDFFKLLGRPLILLARAAKLPLKFGLKHGLIIFNVLAAILLIVFVPDLLKSPEPSFQYPYQNDPLLSYDKPIEVVFNRPIDPNTIKPYIFPEIPGEWKTEAVHSWLPQFQRRVRFYPKESMFSGKVFIYYAGIRNKFGTTEEWEYGIDSKAIDLPNVIGINPEKESKNFSVDSTLEFNLDNKTGKFVKWEFSIEPKVEFQILTPDNENKVVIQFTNLLAQTTKYTYKLNRIPVRYKIEDGSELEVGESKLMVDSHFTTVKEPLLKEITPGGENVLKNTPVKFVFEEEMLKETVEPLFSIDPQAEGQINWESDKVMIFTPKEWQKATKYTFRFGKGMRSRIGGVSQTVIKHLFTTIGYVRVTGFSPGNNYTSVARGVTIAVTFDQKVDRPSAQSKFSISPSVSGAFSWSNNTMYFNPNSDLPYSTTYTIRVAAGVKSVDGLDSKDEFSSRFTTAAEYFVLNVPVYYQSQRFSCNLVATQMALSYRGISTSVGGLHGAIAKDNTPWNESANTWGNPYNGYIGDINGNPKGYGVYWGPIRNLIAAHGGSAQVINGWSRRDVLQKVYEGNPVIVWAHNGYSGSGSVYYWQTPGGTTIRAVQGMHSYVVVGFRGPIDAPTQIILNDSNRGRWTINTSYFDGLWSYFGNSGVIVY